MAKKNITKAVATTAPEAVTPATTIVQPAAVQAPAEVITTAAATSKAAVARKVFDEAYQMSPVPARKDIIAKAVATAGLTLAGAATYLQNYKAKAGLSTKRAA